GTSFSAPSWAGLIALVNQGRSLTGAPLLNSGSATDAQQKLYRLAQSDYHIITSGSNGAYNAAAGYNLVTGLGTPDAQLLVPDLIAENFPTTGQVASINADLNANPGWTGTAPGSEAVFIVFDSLPAKLGG